MQTTAPQNVFEVWQITREIRGVLEVSFDDVWIVGEVSNYKHHSSGHIYLTLQDDRASIAAAFFRQWNRYLNFTPRNGDMVMVHGRIGVYEPRGSYQIIVDRMEPAGEGARRARLDRLKAKLASEGLFDPDRKRPMPSFPRVIGIATSPNGAALRDMLTVTRRRFPNVHILISPCRVQGEGAAEEIAAAVERLNRDGRSDVIIVGRGGGSAEDLWAFNEETVCRAIAASAIPVVSAVGHETDTSLSDMVADLRAPTPSAAAELVVGNQAELRAYVDDLFERLGRCGTRAVHERMQRVYELRGRLRDPKTYLFERGQRLDELVARLESAWKWRGSMRHREIEALALRLREQSPRKNLARQRLQVERLTTSLRAAMRLELAEARAGLQREAGRLNALSPLGVLSRGYAIAFDEKGRAVRDAGSLSEGDQVEVRVRKGRFQARVEKSWSS